MAPVFVLAAGGTVVSRAPIRFTCMLTAIALRTYRRHGYTYPPSFALACSGGCRLTFLRRGTHARRFSHAALLSSEWVPDARFGQRAEIAADAYIGTWFWPRRGIAERIRPLATQSLESGDLESLSISEQIRANAGALSGEPLDVAGKRFEERRGFAANPR